jgi:hypothetical protein
MAFTKWLPRRNGRDHHRAAPRTTRSRPSRPSCMPARRARLLTFKFLILTTCRPAEVVGQSHACWPDRSNTKLRCPLEPGREQSPVRDVTSHRTTFQSSTNKSKLRTRRLEYRSTLWVQVRRLNPEGLSWHLSAVRRMSAERGAPDVLVSHRSLPAEPKVTFEAQIDPRNC